MRFFGLAVAWLAVGLAAGLPAAARAQAPACHAALEGDRLTTAIEFPNGYKVEGPWRVDRGRPVSLSDGNRGVAMAASLDRIVETDPATGERVTTPFPEPIRTTFEGRTEQELVERAAQVWCITVIRAQEQQQRSGRSGPGALAPVPGLLRRS